MSKRHRARSQAQCAACQSRRAQAGLSICRVCDVDTKRRLAVQADLRRDLMITLTRQAKLDPPPEAGKSANRPLPYSVIASEQLGEQLRLLRRWGRLLQAPANVVLGPPSRLISWLLDHWADVRRHDDAAQLVVQLAAVTLSITAAVDHPKMKAVVIGPCPTVDDNGRHCRGWVSAFLPTDGTDRDAWVRCSGCKQEWASNHWTRLVRLIGKRKAALQGVAADVMPGR